MQVLVGLTIKWKIGCPLRLKVRLEVSGGVAVTLSGRNAAAEKALNTDTVAERRPNPLFAAQLSLSRSN